MFQWNVFFCPIISQASCCFWSKPQQHSDRSARTSPSTKFKYLSEQHQCDNNGSCFEVSREHAVCVAEARGKNVGRECGHRAIAPCRTDAEHNESEHVCG